MTSTPDSQRYVVITPCRDEEDHLPRTIETVAAQTCPPTLWIIVDDGSTDATPRILSEAQERHDFIRVVRRENRGRRAVGPGVIEAFYAGLEQVDLDAFDYLCKLDADLIVPPRYFERLVAEMSREPRLGTVSGKVFTCDPDGTKHHEIRGDENSVGPSKFYRVEAFRDIGGFARTVGWDGIDGHVCRLKGWIAKSIMDEELQLLHLRQMGSSDKNVLRGRVRGGLGLWTIGYSPLWVIARSINRLRERPYILGAMCTLWGYFAAMATRKPRVDDPPYQRYMRKFQRDALLRGKRFAAEWWHELARETPHTKAPPPAETDT